MTTTVSRHCIRLGINGRDVAFALSRESVNGWLVERAGRVIGTVYRLESGPAEERWRARPRGRPAAAVGHRTRAAAVAALYEAAAR